MTLEVLDAWENTFMPKPLSKNDVSNIGKDILLTINAICICT